MKTADVLVVLVLVAVGGTLVGCGGATDDADRQLVVDWLIDHDELPEEAECLADELEQYTVADFDALAAISDNTGVDRDFEADVFAALEVCKG